MALPPSHDKEQATTVSFYFSKKKKKHACWLILRQVQSMSHLEEILKPAIYFATQLPFGGYLLFMGKPFNFAF